MRKLKKLASLLLALVMCFGLTCPAFAADTYTITINNSTEGYTYYAYQIFKGDYSDSDGILSNIEWGDGVDSDALLAALQTASADPDSALYGLFDTITSTSTAEDVAKILTSDSITTDSDEMEAFSEIVAACVNNSAKIAFTYDASTGTYTATGVAAGYYLIVNTDVPDSTNASYSFNVIKVVGNAQVNPKTSVPSGEKKVGDVNDSSSTSTTTYDSTADYDIGDDVPFTLTATLGTKFGEYDFYSLTFHDTLSDGLEFNESSVTVTVTNASGTSIVTVPQKTTVNAVTHTNYTVVTDPTDDCTFEVVFEDLKALYDENGDLITVAAGYTVTVSYTAELLSTAAWQETNTMYLEYSNNPYDDLETGTTPKDIVTVFYFTLVVNKYANTTGTALNGAEFTLYKYNAETGQYEEVAVITGTDTNVFTFTGLDDGQYKLVETVTPAGYDTIDPIYF
ncbi:MAG: isopeptide-forming domain-containing fimbrial protein [Clostridiales bacterium]|nr:isopeptide-forming domain-containing fimbrial protein [Clostridiales bacterium]